MNEEREGFDYDKWYQEQAREYALKLIEALSIGLQINQGWDIWDTIEKTVRGLNLPQEPCKKCGAKIDFWHLHFVTHGYCDKCLGEVIAAYERENKELGGSPRPRSARQGKPRTEDRP